MKDRDEKKETKKKRKEEKKILEFYFYSLISRIAYDDILYFV